jgi:hypothetical protein
MNESILNNFALFLHANVHCKNRYVAEHLIRGTVRYVMLFAATHFIERLEEDKDARNQIKELSEDSRMLLKLVFEANDNVPISPLSVELQFSTNDNTEFIFVGTMSNPLLNW